MGPPGADASWLARVRLSSSLLRLNTIRALLRRFRDRLPALLGRSQQLLEVVVGMERLQGRIFFELIVIPEPVGHGLAERGESLVCISAAFGFFLVGPHGLAFSY
jgi:hypothetical protein